MDHGSAVCTLEIGAAAITMYPSYLYDSFSNIVTATLDIVASRTNETVLVVEEPGTYRWKLTPAGTELDLRITAYGEMFAREDDPTGRLVLVASCRLRTFAGAVLSSAQKLFRAHGETGYQNTWGHDFPLKRMQELQQALRNTKSR